MNTDTPRTDAKKVDKGGMTFVWVEFAKELELELEDSKRCLNYQLGQVIKLKNELKSSEAKVEALRAEKNACLVGNEYYGGKVVALQNKINRAIDVLMERIQSD
jgi:hypothetical protein